MDAVLDKVQIDALREIVSIGAGNAATALSQMLKKQISIDVPDINLIPIEEAADMLGGAEKIVTSIYLQMLGDVTGVILFSFSKPEALKFSDLLLNKKNSESEILNEISQSALKETASILLGAYLNALSKLTKMKILMSSPSLIQDMAGAIIGDILIETVKDADCAIIAKTEFIIIGEKIMSYFFFIPDKESLQRILKTMGV